MKTPTLLEMLQAGAHFGHQGSRWHPKMKPYIFTKRGGTHIINLEETARLLGETLDAVKTMASEGKVILFVTTKPQAREIVREAAKRAGAPYLVDRWIGGLLTNFPEMRKLLRKYLDMKEKQASGELERYTKAEQVRIGKELEKQDENLGGIASLTKLPDAIFVPALQREKTAVTEANRTGVPVIGICDTNANPDKADFVIPANDDAVSAIRMMVDLIADAYAEGRAEFEKKQKADAAAAAKAAKKAEADKTVKKPETAVDADMTN